LFLHGGLGELAQTLEDERHMHGGGKVGHTKNLPKEEKSLGMNTCL